MHDVPIKLSSGSPDTLTLTPGLPQYGQIGNCESIAFLRNGICRSGLGLSMLPLSHSASAFACQCQSADGWVQMDPLPLFRASIVAHSASQLVTPEKVR